MKTLLAASLLLLSATQANAACDVEKVAEEAVVSMCGYPVSRANVDAFKIGKPTSNGSIDSFNYLVVCKNYDFSALGMVKFDNRSCELKETSGTQIKL